MKKFIALFLCGILTATALTGCGSSSSAGENGEVIVYNWGEYIDPETLTMFEEETGIKVVYDEFETNEIMYPKVEAGSSAYDVVCPSDYMVQKMIENDLIQDCLLYTSSTFRSFTSFWTPAFSFCSSSCHST